MHDLHCFNAMLLTFQKYWSLVYSFWKLVITEQVNITVKKADIKRSFELDTQPYILYVYIYNGLLI